MSVIIKPIVTEKLTKDGEVFNRFGFIVEKKANKVQIKQAVEAAYSSREWHVIFESNAAL